MEDKTVIAIGFFIALIIVMLAVIYHFGMVPDVPQVEILGSLAFVLMLMNGFKWGTQLL